MDEILTGTCRRRLNKWITISINVAVRSASAINVLLNLLLVFFFFYLSEDVFDLIWNLISNFLDFLAYPYIIM